MRIDNDELDAIVKSLRELHSDLVTKYICGDVFSDKQVEKRRFLTDLEVEFRLKVEDWVNKLKEINQSLH
jgi:hypothetical protein